jgi:hypothetical protein
MSSASGRAKQREDNPLSDQQLVRDCLIGKATAWSDLIFRYKNLIFSIPIRYGFSEEDSADIFQAVCMDLLAELHSLREPKALAGWLIRSRETNAFTASAKPSVTPCKTSMKTSRWERENRWIVWLQSFSRISSSAKPCRSSPHVAGGWFRNAARVQEADTRAGHAIRRRSGVSGAWHDFRRIAHSRGSMSLRIKVAG